MFSILCLCLREMFLFFWCFLFFLSNVSLLALVSEFNCILRSRCSMDMWCPDDIKRVSWGWVGPPTWERACYKSPEWGGGSLPVKNGASPECIIGVVSDAYSTVCMFTTVMTMQQSLRLIYLWQNGVRKKPQKTTQTSSCSVDELF